VQLEIAAWPQGQAFFAYVSTAVIMILAACQLEFFYRHDLIEDGDFIGGNYYFDPASPGFILNRSSLSDLSLAEISRFSFGQVRRNHHG
jgi:hypothetical protein